MRGPVTLLKTSWKHTRTHLVLFAGIYVIPAVASLVLGVVTAVMASPGAYGGPVLAADTPLGIAVYLALLLGTIVISVSGSLALIKAIITPERLSILDAYRYGFRHFLSFLWLSILVGVVTILGYILFIIPGIIVSVWFAFAQFVFVTENQRGVSAMKASREYVRGKWWKVFGRMLALAGVALLLYIPIGSVLAVVVPEEMVVVQDIVLGLVHLVFVPFTFTYMYLLYRDLKEGERV